MDTIFSWPRYTLKRDGLSIFGKYHLCNPQDESLLFVEEKGSFFTVPKPIVAFGDKKKTREILRIISSVIEDYHDGFDVIDASSGQKIGGMGGDMSDFFKDKWMIVDASNKPVASVFEKSAKQAVLRELLDHQLPQQIDVTVGGNLAAEFRQNITRIGYQLTIDFSMDTAGLLDRRLGVAAAILLAYYQGKEI